MHAHAANAYAEAKKESAALTHARAAQFYANLTRGLRDHGLNSAADSLQKEFGGELGAVNREGIAPAAKRGRLPAKCPHCAGPTRSDEVDWIDPFSAECNFCGGVIQTE